MDKEQIIKQVKEIVSSENNEYKSLQHIAEKLNIDKIDLLKIITGNSELLCIFNSTGYDSENGPYIGITNKQETKKIELSNKKTHKNLIREKRIIYLISELLNEKQFLEDILKRFSITFKSYNNDLYEEFIEIMKKYDVIVSELIKNNDTINLINKK